MELVSAHVFISGVVQGVYYRGSLQKEALENQVYGWTRNLPDGRVEALLQGSKENVEAVIHWAESGPSRARVDKVEVEWEEPVETYDSFDIIG
ncbi:MAG: acylphosphatase [Candidatus Syntrophonatronum acetioxidans]|uniref:acylphosphatase n=1 Tax=Candidatus Syntrophonatronum acetioxidans TaxID=1795816 RepID=A0A424YAA6_9FIRM|nr:MAG: acylphosphatase [Candidatus Syntrophonatronum acetioxidans]